MRGALLRSSDRTTTDRCFPRDGSRPEYGGPSGSACCCRPTGRQGLVGPARTAGPPRRPTGRIRRRHGAWPAGSEGGIGVHHPGNGAKDRLGGGHRNRATNEGSDVSSLVAEPKGGSQRHRWTELASPGRINVEAPPRLLRLKRSFEALRSRTFDSRNEGDHPRGGPFATNHRSKEPPRRRRPVARGTSPRGPTTSGSSTSGENLRAAGPKPLVHHASKRRKTKAARRDATSDPNPGERSGRSDPLGEAARARASSA